MSEPTPAAHTGAIHDIGYRRYDGRRLGAAYIRRSLFVDTLRGGYGLGRSARSKIMPFLLLGMMVLPAVVMGIVTGYFQAPSLPVQYTEYVILLQIAVTIFLGSQSPAVMSRDLRFRVAPLYFSRPLSRQQYVQAKYAGMAAALLILMGLPITLLLAGALLAELPLSDQLPDYLRAMAGAVLYAVVLAGIGLLVAAMTPRRGLGVAAVVGVLLVLSGLQIAVGEMAFEFGNTTFLGYTGLISPYTLVDGVVTGALGAEPSVGQGPPGVTGTAVFVAVTVLIVLGCYGALVARYRKALS
ncbi:ABC transporter permease [Ornithinicoccus halotolerans]|uniref:ABC transporter permease n=1 Tax=Ornithinicoccus halotolerans TaxID=1748220 RepID=UPI0012965BBB|nr:ABC transporter permease subunit [Ornithinicoccus halotolerans]